MANKQITDLAQVTSLGGGDLFLTRVASAGIDNKITKSDLVKTMGNPAVNGFSATSTAANRVTLASSNNANIDTYYDCMRVGFISPINSSGEVQIQIGNDEIADLSYKPLKQYNSETTVILTENDYIEAVYIAADNSFYQTNVPTNTIYTNDYLAEGIVSGDNSTTTYTLTSAIGMPAQSYYKGMSIIFTSDIASKGGVLVNVDGLGNKVLTDKAGDKIANDLTENQVIIAIYDGNNFIKNYFSESVPDAPELPAEAIDEKGDVIIENVPAVNKLQVTVGTAGNDYTTLQAAISDLVNNFGEDGGNRLCTILVSDTYVWDTKLTLKNKEYEWITIRSSNNVNFTDAGGLQLIKSSITLSGKYTKTGAYNSQNPYFIACENSSSIKIQDFTFVSTNGLLFVQNSQFSLINTRFQVGGYRTCIDAQNAFNSSINNAQITHNTAGDGNKGYFNFNSCKVNLEDIDYNSASQAAGISPLMSFNSEISIVNSRFIITNNYSGQGIKSKKDILFTATEVTITGPSNGGNCLSVEGSKMELDRCIMSSPFQNASLVCRGGADVTVSGGSYTHTNQGAPVTSPNIGASGEGTIVRITNNPTGTKTYATRGAIITNE